MPVNVGDQVPDVEVKTMGEDGNPRSVRTSEALGTGKVVLFGVPGAFTPTCSKQHLPGFLESADQLAAHNVDRVVCVSVNDAWVMQAWADSQGVGDRILMLADGSAHFTKAMGLELDGDQIGLGTRSVRYAAVIDDGVITSLDVEPGRGVEVSSCANVLRKL